MVRNLGEYGSPFSEALVPALFSIISTALGEMPFGQNSSHNFKARATFESTKLIIVIITFPLDSREWISFRIESKFVVSTNIISWTSTYSFSCLICFSLFVNSTVKYPSRSAALIASLLEPDLFVPITMIVFNKSNSFIIRQLYIGYEWSNNRHGYTSYRSVTIAGLVYIGFSYRLLKAAGHTIGKGEGREPNETFNDSIYPENHIR